MLRRGRLIEGAESVASCLLEIVRRVVIKNGNAYKSPVMEKVRSSANCKEHLINKR